MIANLKTLRARNKISQADLAKAIGTTQQSIAHYERGDVNPSLPMLIKLADYFNTSIDYLVGRTDIDRPVEGYKAADLDGDEFSVMEDYRGMDEYSKGVFRHSLEIMKGNDFISDKTKKKKH